jgi:hypothetical protein
VSAVEVARPARAARRLPTWFVLGAALVLLAVAVALTWWALVPQAEVIEVDGVVASRGPGDDVLAGADSVFVLLALVAGGLAGVAVLLLGRDQLLGAASWGVVGGMPAALLAWQLGRWMGPAPVGAQRAAGVEQLQAPLHLSAPLVLALAWPGATATVVFAGLLVWLLVRPPGHDG